MVNGDAEVGEALGFDLDLNFFFKAAVDADGCYAFETFEVGAQPLFGNAPHLHQAQIAVKSQAHYGVERGVEAQEDGLVGVARQVGQIELFADVERGKVHVGAPAEFDDHIGDARPRNRRDADHVADHADQAFDRLGNEALDFEGSHALVFGADGDGGIGDVRQEVDG